MADQCPNCEGTNFEWFIATTNTGNAMDGRLKMNDISALAVKGCLDCSQTIKVLRQDQIDSILNEHADTEERGDD